MQIFVSDKLLQYDIMKAGLIQIFAFCFSNNNNLELS